MFKKIDWCKRLLRYEREDWRAWRMIYDRKKDERVSKIRNLKEE